MLDEHLLDAGSERVAISHPCVHCFTFSRTTIKLTKGEASWKGAKLRQNPDVVLSSFLKTTTVSPVTMEAGPILTLKHKQ